MAGALVQAGAAVMIVGRREEVLRKAAEELRAGGGAVVPYPADLARKADIPQIVDRAMKEFGKIDFLINNAGTIFRAPVEDFPEAEWDLVIETNLKGPFFLAQAVARTMIAGKIPGSIVNTSSLIAFIGGKNVPAYAASKAGITQVTKSLANGLAQYGIRVNAIAPGWFETELTEALMKDKQRYEGILGRIPMNRWGKPDELGGAAVFLVSGASSYMTGQTIVVDGGWLSN
jgi:2-deoxy-D-gluconate 3-dehydrogenase